MNWKKRRSSFIFILLLLLMNCPGNANARQLYSPAQNIIDTISPPSTETILKIVSRNLIKNNPSSFNSYSAIKLRKLRIKTNLSHDNEHLTNDSTNTIDNRDNTGTLFSTEILSSQKLLKPGFSQSEKLSVKVAGKEKEVYTKLANSLIDFSILKPVNNLFGNDYLSPFSEESFHYYDYSLNDSITKSGDSLYRISFQPKQGENFDGFYGSALIDPIKFDILQINAQSTQNDPNEPLFVINESFELLEGSWLPSEIKIKVFINNNFDSGNENNFIAESSTSVYQQQINPPLTPADFKYALSQARADSTAFAEFQNRQAKMIRMMAEGKVSLGYFNIDYNKIVGYNLYEGVKLGLGGETNRLLSSHFTIGGYFSYGLKDKSLRHGEWINFYPRENSNLRINLSYKDMNLEFGGHEFLETKSLLNPESYRDLLIKNMFSVKRYSTGLEYRPSNELDIYLFGDLSENHSRQNTPFLIAHPFIPISLSRAGLQLRFSPGIELKMEDGRLDEVTAPKADFFATFIQGVTILSGEYQYTKLELKGRFNLPFSGIGTTSIIVRGGMMTQDAPIIELYNGYGSYAGTFSLAAPYTFATMQLNEFSAANYTAVHLRHNFSTWLFPDKFKTRPAFIFAQNIGVGELNNGYMTQYHLSDYRKGFYESGFEINNLLRMNFLSWGLGIYYRYGPYQFSTAGDNFAYKFGFIFKL